MKATRLVHPSHARSVLSEVDAARLRSQGWCELPETRPVSQGAAWQRRHREQCRAAGLKRLTAWLPAETYDVLVSMKQPGETTAELLGRLAKLLHSRRDQP